MGKGYPDFLLLDAPHRELAPVFHLDDRFKGHQLLEGWIWDMLETHGCISHLYAAVESTGGFEDNWFSCLAPLGATLPIKESGDKRDVSRMSKKGRPAIRATLFMCAHTAVLQDAPLKSIYARHRAKGKAPKQALGAVVHKMPRMIGGVLGSGKSHGPLPDQENILKTMQAPRRSIEMETRPKRTLHPFDDGTPNSMLAAKKKKGAPKVQSQPC